MSGRKPDVSIKVKSATGEGGNISLAAFWREEGKLRGGWDKRVVKVQMRLDDGTVVVIEKRDGKWSHYCNAWEERGEVAKPKPRNDEPPPDFGDDSDLPF